MRIQKIYVSQDDAWLGMERSGHGRLGCILGVMAREEKEEIHLNITGPA